MNVVSVKNGEPERQTAKDCYRIRETGLSSSGMLPRQDDALMEVSRAHARAADFFPVVTLQGKHSRECRFYQKCRASVGWRHVGPACFAVPAGYQKRISLHSLQAHGRRPRVQILPRSQKGKALTMDVVRAFFVLSSFPSCGKALCSATAFRLPPQALPQLQHEARPGIARCVLFIVKDGPDGQILLETETFL